jgi:hypothetical protein
MNGRQSANNLSVGVGLVPRSLQLDLEKEEKKIEQFETTNKKFYKDVKYYVEKIDELNKSESKMVNNLANIINTSHTTPNVASNASSHDTLVNDSSDQNELNNREIGEKLKLWKDMLNEHGKATECLKNTCQSQVIEPMKNLNLMFPQVYAAIKKREQSYKELLKQQDKLEKAQEKERTGQNLVRISDLTQSVQLAKQQFQKEHLYLMEELPKFYDSRVDYIKPCVDSMIQAQAKFYESYSNLFDAVLNGANTTDTNGNRDSTLSSSTQPLLFNSNHNVSNTQIDTEKLDDEIKKCLADIRSLSIVAGD